MQLELMPDDFSDKRTLVSLSGGIDSMALLCYLATVYPAELRPRQLFIIYVHLAEHSPTTALFIKSGIRYAQKHFQEVVYRLHDAGSVNDYFRQEGVIPHPMLSPCSEHLKMEPINAFKVEHDIEIDMVAFLRGEKNRIRRAVKRGALEQGKHFLISQLVQSDAFEIVDREIGWHPAIYDIRNEKGERVFKHNNCLDCKNMNGILSPDRVTGDFANVMRYYPKYHEQALKTAVELGCYWGREEKHAEGHCGFCEV